MNNEMLDLPLEIMRSVEKIVDAKSIEEITDLEMKVKNLLQRFISLYPHKHEEIELIFLREQGPFHSVIIFYRSKLTSTFCPYSTINVAIDFEMMKNALQLDH